MELSHWNHEQLDTLCCNVTQTDLISLRWSNAQGSDYPRLRERSVVVQECRSRGARGPSFPLPPTPYSLAPRPPGLGLHFTGESPFPTLLLGLGCSPRTRTRPSSPSQEWGEDRAGSTAGKRGQQRLWEYSPRSARPLTPPPSLAQAGQRSGGAGSRGEVPNALSAAVGPQPQGGE